MEVRYPTKVKSMSDVSKKVCQTFQNDDPHYIEENKEEKKENSAEPYSENQQQAYKYHPGLVREIKKHSRYSSEAQFNRAIRYIEAEIDGNPAVLQDIAYRAYMDFLSLPGTARGKPTLATLQSMFRQELDREVERQARKERYTSPQSNDMPESDSGASLTQEERTERAKRGLAFLMGDRSLAESWRQETGMADKASLRSRIDEWVREGNLSYLFPKRVAEVYAEMEKRGWI